jgi:peptidylprolyl isomerase
MPQDHLKKSLPVIALLAVCGVLTIAIAMWVGPDEPRADLSETETLDPLPAPLTAEELAAYNVDMTNDNNPVAVFTTNKGVIEIELFEDRMPITAGNFAKLASEGFYNGTLFHRVIDGFMIQGGDPLTKTSDVFKYGTGGPGYSIPDEHIKGEYLTNVRGTIAMANSGPNSGGSQFFINVVDNKALDFDVPDPNNSQHPVFGRVVSGMDVVDAISAVATGPRDLPTEPILIETVEIRRP